MINRNIPFETLDPVANYIGALEAAVNNPNPETSQELMTADEVLTARAVLFPEMIFVSNEGYRVIGYEPCTISDGVTHIIKLAQDSPGDIESNELGSRDSLQRNARGALITLGGHLAVSGAYYNKDIVPAYNLITDGIYAIGDGREDFAKFGKRRIGLDLLNKYGDLVNGRADHNPISRRDAEENIAAAWTVVGKPYGVFAKLVGALKNS